MSETEYCELITDTRDGEYSIWLNIPSEYAFIGNKVLHNGVQFIIVHIPES